MKKQLEWIRFNNETRRRTGLVTWVSTGSRREGRIWFPFI